MLNVKRFICLLLLLLLAVSSFSACGEKEQGEGEETVVYYTVNFRTGGAEAIAPVQVAGGSSVAEPPLPAREGFVFGEWLYDGAVWDFRAPVEEDMTLTATWISVDTLFEYERIDETDTAMITGVLGETSRLAIPEMIGGYRVVAIGREAFAEVYSKNIEEIIVPKTVVSIGEYAFRDTKYIPVILSEDTVITQLGEGAFLNCAGLQSITLGEGIETIPFQAFSGCTGLEEVRLPKSVQVLEENAFEGCSALVTLMLHGGITSVEDGVFSDCDGLKTIFFQGTAEEAETLLEEKTAGMNHALTNADLYLYSEDKPTAESEYGFWYFDRNGKAKIW